MAGTVSGYMMDTLNTFMTALLGLDREAFELEFRHMAWRTILVFPLAILLVRRSARRLIGQNAGFDIIVAIVLGSVLSRAINGDAAFFPTVGASVLLVSLHHVMATLAFHSHWVSELIKGRPHVLVRNGVVDRAEMARTKITGDDLDENLRLHGNVDRTDTVVEARLERNGAISVIKSRARER